MEQSEYVEPRGRAAAHTILNHLEPLREGIDRPLIVALDGGSGSGKSTIATQLAELDHMAVLPLDDFYQRQIRESDWPSIPVPERWASVFEWDRVRAEAIEALRQGIRARWQLFDFAQGLDATTGTYRLSDVTKELAPVPTIVIDGAYSASPFLADLIDVSVLVNTPVPVRHQRLIARERDDEAFLAQWHDIWDAVEQCYFTTVCPPEAFDLVIEQPETR